MMKICILSSTHAATGGTELLQQLCYQLRKNNMEAYMYYTEKYLESKVQNKFENTYKNPVIHEIPDGTIGVVPETEMDTLYRLQKNFSEIYIWWLSVDNYYGSGRMHVSFTRSIYRKLKHHRNITIFKKAYHLVQSQYAHDYLTKELKITQTIEYLSDYLNLDYLHDISVNKKEKKNWILYNPKKGYEFTSRLISAIPEYTWIALEGFSNSEMKKVLSKAKVYVDFGNHPGKDRIPREAAINYCCVITSKRGAAANSIDIPIDDKYKFTDREDNISSIHKAIKQCVENYEEVINCFQVYREMITLEPEKFVDDVRRIFGNK